MTSWWTPEAGFDRAVIMREAHRSARATRRPFAERLRTYWIVAKIQRDAIQEVAAFWARHDNDPARVRAYVASNELNHGG